MSKKAKGVWGLRTNKNKETAGIWIQYPDNALDVTVKIKRAGGSNYGFDAAYAEAVRPFQTVAGVMKPDAAAFEKLRKAISEVLVDEVMIDWKGTGICDEESGEPLPFTRENAMKVLTVDSFYEWVLAAAKNEALFRDDVNLEEEAKN